MENRSPSLLSRFFQTVGLGATIPKPIGPKITKSTYYRIPKEQVGGCLVQIFYPVESVISPQKTSSSMTTTAAITTTSTNNTSWNRTYRNGVIRGFGHFSKTNPFVLKLFLEASSHPLSNNNSTNQAEIHYQVSESLPLVVFSHGLGGNCETYTKICSDIASHGYIVIAIEHEDGSASHAKDFTGKLIPYEHPPHNLQYNQREQVTTFRHKFLCKREMELNHLLQFLQSNAIQSHSILKSVNKNQMFLAGHSFGSAFSVFYLNRNPTSPFKKLILFDIWSYSIPDSIVQTNKLPPTCSILSEPFFKGFEGKSSQKLLNIVELSFYIPGSVHSSFSGTPWWTPQWLGKNFALVGNQDPNKVQKAIVDVSIRFLLEEQGDYEQLKHQVQQTHPDLLFLT